MSQDYFQKDLAEVIAGLSKRISNLETGGKPITEISSTLSLAGFTLSAGQSSVITNTLAWSNSDVEAVMLAVPKIAIYIDNDEDIDYLYGGGANVDEDDHHIFWQLLEPLSLDKNILLAVYVKNQDSVSHEYFFHSIWPFVSGSSGSGS